MWKKENNYYWIAGKFDEKWVVGYRWGCKMGKTRMKSYQNFSENVAYDVFIYKKIKI